MDKPRQHTMTFDRTGHDQMTLLMIAWHTFALECSAANERVVCDYVSTRCRSIAPPSIRSGSEMTIQQVAAQRSRISRAATYRSGRLSGHIQLSKSPRSRSTRSGVGLHALVSPHYDLALECCICRLSLIFRIVFSLYSISGLSSGVYAPSRVDCIPVDGQDNLFLLPGHIRLAEYEVTLGIAQELSGSIQTLQNLPGSIAYLLDQTAEKFNADYILIDMSPSLSSINQNLLMTSHFFMVPTSPDYFSVMAIDSLATVLPKWYNWSKKAQNFQLLQEASYPFPKVMPKFLGTIVQKYRPRGGVPASAFQKWIEQIDATVKNRLVPVLRENEMMLDQEVYDSQNVNPGYCLASISDFNSLIAKSQQTQTPVFALSRKQLEQRGGALNNTIRSRDKFNETFEELGNKIIEMVSHAAGN